MRWKCSTAIECRPQRKGAATQTRRRRSTSRPQRAHSYRLRFEQASAWPQVMGTLVPEPVFFPRDETPLRKGCGPQSRQPALFPLAFSPRGINNRAHEQKTSIATEPSLSLSFSLPTSFPRNPLRESRGRLMHPKYPSPHRIGTIPGTGEKCGSLSCTDLKTEDLFDSR